MWISCFLHARKPSFASVEREKGSSRGRTAFVRIFRPTFESFERVDPSMSESHLDGEKTWSITFLEILVHSQFALHGGWQAYQHVP